MTSLTPPPDPDDLVARRQAVFVMAVALAYYEDLIVRAREDSRKAMIEVGLLPGGREPVIVDDVQVGTVNRPKITKRIAGFNQPAFLEWVKVRYPTEVTLGERVVQVPMIETVEEIQPAFTKLFKVTKTGDAVGPNGETDIPGLTVTTPRSSPSVRPDHEAIAALWPELPGLLDRILTPTNTTTTEEK